VRRRVALAELARVDVDVDESAGRLQRGREAVGRDITERGADREDDVDAVIDVRASGAMTTQAEHAERQLVALREHAFAFRRRRDRAAEAFGDLA
jgi:hypothetical protein